VTHHVGDDLMRRFIQGDLDEQVAVAVARHMDDCPRCASRAAVDEPLAPAFAAVEDPRPPPGLTDDILIALGEQRLPAVATAEMAAAAVLLTAAALVLAVGGDPAGLAAEAATALSAIGTGGSVLISQLYLAPLGWSALAAGLGFGLCAWLARRMGAWSRGAR